MKLSLIITAIGAAIGIGAGAWLGYAIAQLYNQEMAAAAKLALGRVYPDEHPVTRVRAAPSGDTTRKVPLAQATAVGV